MVSYGIFMRTIIKKITASRKASFGFDSFGEIQSELEKRDIIIINSGFERIANNYKDLNEDQKSDIDKLLEMCEGDDDVQNVYHNIGNS